MTRIERKKEFIRAIAEYLAGNQAGKSIALELENENENVIVKWAKEWQKLRSLSSIGGYPTGVEGEAEVWKVIG